MASTTVRVEIDKVPLLRFIIALLLVKSKPNRLSSRDFLQQLRSCIQRGPRSDLNTEARNHVDTTTMWRNAYTKSEEEKVALEAKVARLEEREKQLMEAEHEDLRSAAASQRNLRKRPANEPVKAPTCRNKKLRTSAYGKALSTQSSEAQTVVHSREDDEVDDEVDEGPERNNSQGNAFLPHLYFLERILVAEVIHVKNLSLTLCQVSTDICGLLGAVGYRTDEGSTTATRISTRGVNGQALTPVHQDLDEEVEQKILAVGRTFPYLLTSLQKLSKLSASETLQGQVVYNYIKILHSLLERICSIAAVSVGKSQENTPSSTMAKPSYKEESKPVATPANKRPAMLPNLTKLCELLVSMVACLDLTKKNHKDIVEGFLYHLMKRLGDGLEYFVFGAHGHGISDEHMNNRQARRDPGPMSVKAAAAGRATMEAQAPYLIWILERVRHAGSRNVRSTTSIQTTDDAQGQPTTTPPSASVAAFYRNSRARLQHTLLRSVFGAQVASEFIPALDPPQAPSTDELAAALGSDFETTEVRDWYKLEVWRLVGWDVLRGHIAW